MSDFRIGELVVFLNPEDEANNELVGTLGVVIRPKQKVNAYHLSAEEFLPVEDVYTVYAFADEGHYCCTEEQLAHANLFGEEDERYTLVALFDQRMEH